jgi:hypothetical protein
MARALTFRINQAEYQAVPTKIERKKLYGWTETLALDDHDNECRMVSTDESGIMIIPKGGTGIGILSPDGKWVNRSQLQAVKEDGEPAEIMPSSFNISIELERKVSFEEYMDHNITAFYQMDEADTAFIEAIGDDIYTFTYNYRDSYDGSPAFLLTAEDPGKGRKLFLLIGTLIRLEMLRLEESGVIEEVEGETDADDSDEIDFSMF